MFGHLIERRTKIPNSRRFKRVRAACLLKYKVQGQGKFRVVNAKDISAGGLSFWTDERIPESSILDLEIFISPDQPPVTSVGRVVQVRKDRTGSVYQVAVSFLDVKREEREGLARLADQLLEDKDTQSLVDHGEWVNRRSS